MTIDSHPRPCPTRPVDREAVRIIRDFREGFGPPFPTSKGDFMGPIEQFLLLTAIILVCGGLLVIATFR